MSDTKDKFDLPLEKSSMMCKNVASQLHTKHTIIASYISLSAEYSDEHS